MSIKYAENAEIVWKDRKHICGLPLSFTRYSVAKNDEWTKLFIDIGFLSSTIDEVNMYRVYDISLSQTLMGKIFNTGTITIYSNDQNMPTLELVNVKDPCKIRDMLSNLMEAERKKKRIGLAEIQV